MNSCQDSIGRLKCEYIDLYHLHWPTRHVNNWGAASQYSINTEKLPAGKDMGTRADFVAQVETVKTLFEKGLIKNWALSNEKVGLDDVWRVFTGCLKGV